MKKQLTLCVSLIVSFWPAIALCGPGLHGSLSSTKDDVLGFLADDIAPLCAIAAFIYTVWSMAKNEGKGAGIAISVCIASIVGMNFGTVLDIMQGLAKNLGR